MAIRLATVADIAEVAALVERYWEFESIGGFDRPRVEMLLGDLLAAPERGACWVAEADGRLCGYLLAVFMFSLEHGGSMAEIDEIFVSPDMRSAGVGALMLATSRYRGTLPGIEVAGLSDYSYGGIPKEETYIIVACD
jgi:GNAT superfamily N-acetyltransferase